MRPSTDDHHWRTFPSKARFEHRKLSTVSLRRRQLCGYCCSQRGSAKASLCKPQTGWMQTRLNGVSTVHRQSSQRLCMTADCSLRAMSSLVLDILHED